MVIKPNRTSSWLIGLLITDAHSNKIVTILINIQFRQRFLEGIKIQRNVWSDIVLRSEKMSLIFFCSQRKRSKVSREEWLVEVWKTDINALCIVAYYGMYQTTQYSLPCGGLYLILASSPLYSAVHQLFILILKNLIV